MPSASAGTTALRPTDRRALVETLERLASPDPAERAKAGLRAAELVQRRRATWTELLLPATGDDAGSAVAVAPTVADWPAPAVALIEHPDTTEEDRAALRRVAAWRAPGKAGLEVLRRAEARVRG